MTYDTRETSVSQVIRDARVAAAKASADEAQAAQVATNKVAEEAAAAKLLAAAEAQAAAAAASSAAAAAGGETKAAPVFKAAYTSDDGVVYCIGAYAGNVDLDKDVLQTKALVRMAYDFTKAGTRTFKANHNEKLEADLVASMPGAPILKSGRVLKAGEDMPDDDPVTGICLKSEPIAWFVGIRPHDPEVVKLAKAGKLAGTSWGAFASREE